MDTISCPWISKIFGTSITSAPLFFFYTCTSCRQRYPIDDGLVYTIRGSWRWEKIISFVVVVWVMMMTDGRPCFAALYHPSVRQFVERSWIFDDTRAIWLLSHKKGHLLFLFKWFQIFKKAREFPASRKRGFAPEKRDSEEKTRWTCQPADKPVHLIRGRTMVQKNQKFSNGPLDCPFARLLAPLFTPGKVNDHCIPPNERPGHFWN